MTQKIRQNPDVDPEEEIELPKDEPSDDDVEELGDILDEDENTIAEPDETL